MNSKISVLMLLLFFGKFIHAQQLNWTTSWDIDGNSVFITDSHIDGQNNLFTAGYNSGGTQMYDCILNKFSPQGTHQFTKYYYTGGFSGIPLVTTCSQGNIYIFRNLYVNVLTPAGDSLLQFGHDSFNCRAIHVDSAGNIFLFSVSYDNDNNKFGPRIIKYNEFGIEMWDYVPFPLSIPNGESARINDAIIDQEGNSTITGSIYRNGAHSIFTAKMDYNGLLLWEDEFNLSGKTIMRGNKIATSGAVTYVTGCIGKEYYNNSIDAITLAYNSDGSLLWSKVFNLNSDYDEAFDIKVFGSGIVVSGLSKSNDSTFMFVANYGINGNENWLYIDDNPKWIDSYSFVNFPPLSTGIITAGNDVYITGTIKPTQAVNYYTTVKLNYLGNYRGRIDIPSEFVGRVQNSYKVNNDIILFCTDQNSTSALSYIKLISYNSNIITGISELDSYTPEFILEQNYPNPFNPSTKIKFAIPVSFSSQLVTLKLYNILGKELVVLVNEIKNPGFYEIAFDASHLASGVYFYVLQVGSFKEIRKMSIIK